MFYKLFKKKIKLLYLAAFLLATGCSTIKFAYNNAPFLLSQYIDDYISFTHEQEKILSAELQAIQQWHRQHKLLEYAQKLDAFAKQIEDGLEKEEAEKAIDFLLTEWHSILLEIIPGTALLLTQLSSEQVAEFDKNLDDKLLEKQQELNKPLEERLAERFENTVDVFEDWYGRFSQHQRAALQKTIEQTKDRRGYWLQQRKNQHKKFISFLYTNPSQKSLNEYLHKWLIAKQIGYSIDYQDTVIAAQQDWVNMWLLMDRTMSESQRRHIITEILRYRDHFLTLSKNPTETHSLKNNYR